MTEQLEKAAAKPPRDCLVRWLRWPENKRTGMVPWFVIAWRLLCTPLIYGGIVLAWVGIAMANGRKQANYFWRRAT